MTVTVDTSTENVRTLTTSPQTFSHGGAASGVKGVVLALVHGTSSTDHVSAASYGGVAMVRKQRNTDTATEPGAAELWFLGAGVPQGTQTVSYTPGATTDDFHAVCITLLADRDLEVIDQDGVSENTANPSVTLQYGGKSAMAFAALYGGGADPTAFAPNANCTTVQDHDLGAFYSEVIRQTTAGTADFAIGGTSSTDDVAFAAIAVAETLAITPNVGAAVIGGLAPYVLNSANNKLIEPPAGAMALEGHVAFNVIAATMLTGEMQIQGAGPSVFEEAGTDFGGGGPGLLFGISLNLEPVAGVVITPPAGAMTAGGLAPTLGFGVATPAGTVSAGGLAPTITAVVDPGVGSMTVTGYAVTMDRGIAPGLGAIAITGYAPVSTVVITTGAGSITATGYEPGVVLGPVIIQPVGAITALGYAATFDVAYSVGVGALTIDGLAPTFVAGKFAAPEQAALTIAGLAPTVTLSAALPVGSAVITGLAPTVLNNKTLLPGVGAAVVSGLAPKLGFSFTIPVGAAVVGGLAPTAVVPGAGGGGGPGLSLLFGLNIEVNNFTFSPPAGTIEVTEWAPAWGAGYSYTTGIGAVTIAGYAPSVSTTAGNQTPVMAAPVAMSITGHAPTVAAGLVVRFPFPADTMGFVGTPGPGSVMIWSSGTGSAAPGSLRTRTTGFSRTDLSVWTLTTDWQTLGVPADTVITSISLKSIDTRVTQCDGGSGEIRATTLTPTGFPQITIAPSRTYSAAESVWTTDGSSQTTGLELPSGGSLTIRAGNTANTDATGTPDIIVFHDDIRFVVSYVAAKSISPPVGTIGITGRAPTVTAQAAQFAQPAQAALQIQGAGPSLQVNTPVTGGGGGPGLLFLLSINIEQTPLGAASLAITGYAPVVVRPITLGGSDDLISLTATMVGSGNKIVAGGSTIEAPANAALTLAGLAPTLVETGSRLIAMPVTALTITRFVPTTGIAHVIVPGVGTISVNGLGLSVEPNYTISPIIGSASITGRAPTVLVSTTITVGAGSIAFAGEQPNLQREVVSGPFAGVISTAGYAPFVSATDSRRVDSPVGTAVIAGLAPTSGVSHVRTIDTASLIVSSVGPNTDVPPVAAIVDGPPSGVVLVSGLSPTVLVSVESPVATGAIDIQGFAPQVAQSTPITVPAGSATVEGFAPLLTLATWNGTGALASQRATVSSTETVIRTGSGVLQSQHPLAFVGTGVHGPTATGAMQSGPASLNAAIQHGGGTLLSGRATLKARARIIPYKPHKRPKPQRVNRYTVTLRPSKRHRTGKPPRRRPFK